MNADSKIIHIHLLTYCYNNVLLITLSERHCSLITFTNEKFCYQRVSASWVNVSYHDYHGYKAFIFVSSAVFLQLPVSYI